MASDHVIEVPSGDTRVYRYLELPNKLKTLLISDPAADKAAAAMDVNVGSLTDPVDVQGLAHFLEHMLFLGSKPFPDENEYSRFLSTHGGHSNAFTTATDTTYFFDVAPAHLGGALDRFSRFFIDPLFDESCTERELNAVHSEHEKNLKSDVWRLMQLNKHTSAPDSAYHKFSTGSRATLANRHDLRDRLLAFHKTYYSADIMSLCVLGREPLNQLEEMVVSRFSEVPLLPDVPPRLFLEHPHGPDQLRKRFDVVPVKHLRSLELSFPIPDQAVHYKTQPSHYLAHLIGHEGAGSLLSFLKHKEYADGLCAGGYTAAAFGFGFFKITIDLTDHGLQHIDDILAAVFQYINMLRAAGAQAWIFDECKRLYEMEFRFQDQQQPIIAVRSTVRNLHLYEVPHVLKGPYVLEDYRPELIEAVLACLVPEKMRVTVVAKECESAATLSEPIYGTQYAETALDDALLEQLARAVPDPQLRLPKPNKFIPSDFSLRAPPGSGAGTGPQLLRDTPRCRLWHKQDTQFGLPKTTWYLLLNTPLAYASPWHCNLTHLAVELLKDELNEGITYEAELGGIRTDAFNTKYGVQLVVSGFSEKIGELITVVFERLADPSAFRAERFAMIKDMYRRTLQSFSAAAPNAQAARFFQEVMYEKAYSHAERLAVLDDSVTLADVSSFVQQLLRRMHLEALAVGNLSPGEARAVVDKIDALLTTTMRTGPLSVLERRSWRQHELPLAATTVFTTFSSVQTNNCLNVYFQVGIENMHDNTCLSLLQQTMSETFFDQLRTKEQLGYIVGCGVRRMGGVQGLVFVVQSEKTPAFLDRRVESFLVQFEEMLAGMDAAAYQEYVQARVTKLLDKPKSIKQEAAQFWGEIADGQFLFDRNALEAEEVLGVEQAELLAFFRKYIKAGGAARRKLSVRFVVGQQAHAGAAVQTQEEKDAEAEVDGVDGEAVVRVDEDSLLDFKLSRPLLAPPAGVHHEVVGEADAAEPTEPAAGAAQDAATEAGGASKL